MKHYSQVLLECSKVFQCRYEMTRTSGSVVKAMTRKDHNRSAIRTIRSACFTVLTHPPIPRRRLIMMHFTNRTFSTATAKSMSSSKDTTKTVSDHFLDNLGKIFLSIIGMIIVTLVRSSYATSDRTALRSKTEVLSALDPFEIDDLRVANDELTPEVFRKIVSRLEDLGYLQEGGGTKMEYTEFVSIVMMTMQAIKNEGFTIQLGHLIDRVLIDIQKKKEAAQDVGMGDRNVHSTDGAQNKDVKMDVMLLLTASSLALHSSVKERVEVLYEIMQKLDDPHRSLKDRVTLSQIEKMIGYLQQTCQLVPDSQIVETNTKYPYQTHRIGKPEELVRMGQTMKKEELTEHACVTSQQDCQWTCQDFHHLIRSKSVCAWGECYVKTKALDEGR